ncbi:PspC domain-containing protein [Candidatus Viridilinea mediisalina]|uniref:Phage shock protein PspC N-terminal domain-containing protein n=1 Tax=Candidatus Viridilinea mediisalina TaxID=2024553 RepID=A0A2A6RG06_9CHLR|nr:PspC domain-containing protein [Candidatus Viridilinea mediisalina]PDW01873.1 hypothetical protein CJ255_16890 [Candidatus Viridilinea mediisalina]
MHTTTRLMRSRSDRMLAGVAGGLAHYLNIDSTLVRIIFILIAVSGPVGLIYLLLWFIMPQEPNDAAGQVFVSTGATQRLRIDPMTSGPTEGEHEVPISNVGANREPAAASQGQGGRFIGAVLLGLGIFITLKLIWPGFASLIFPLALIGAGIWLMRREA